MFDDLNDLNETRRSKRSSSTDSHGKDGNETMGWRIGIDIGGTFTDVAVLDETSGRVGIAKVSTTPHDFGAAVIEGTRAAMDEYCIAPETVSLLSHATTIVTNALLESKGANVALVATRSFRRRARDQALHPRRPLRPLPGRPRGCWFPAAGGSRSPSESASVTKALKLPFTMSGPLSDTLFSTFHTVTNDAPDSADNGCG